MLTELQAKIDAAKAMLNEPRTTIVDRHKATQDLGALFVTIDLLLEKQIDRLMAPLAITHADLHDRYFKARQLPRRARSGEKEAVAVSVKG